MRKLYLVAGLFSCGVVLLGCPKKKDDGAGGAAADAEAAVVAVVVDAGPAPVVITAKNTADVARFPGETVLADDDRKLLQTTLVRTAPKGGGNVVTTLKAGADVTKVAEFQGSILVTVADPKDATATLLGWISKDAFSPFVFRGDAGPRPDAGPVKLICAAGTIAVILGQDPLCKKKCTKDADCKTTGAGTTCANANSVAGQVVKVCTD